MKVDITINGQGKTLDVEKGTPLLWVIRDEVGLTGTKFGCGMGLCGACTVHLNGEAVRSCQIEIGDAEGADITTIEGLDPKGNHPVQQAWLELQVPQCGYCQSGMQMAVASFLAENPNPTDDDIDAKITNICRCGCYERIREAIHFAVDSIRSSQEDEG